MKSTGFVRKLDVLGRLTIPSELRKQLDILEKDAVEIFMNDGYVLLKKYEPCDMFTGEMEELIDFEGKKVSKKTILRMAEVAGLSLQ
jgi:transcriptional pleiotropic regulator of transition state genes